MDFFGLFNCVDCCFADAASSLLGLGGNWPGVSRPEDGVHVYVYSGNFKDKISPTKNHTLTTILDITLEGKSCTFCDSSTL